MDEIAPLVSKVIQIMSLNTENRSEFITILAKISNPIEKLKLLLQYLIQEFSSPKISPDFNEINLLINKIHEIIDECPLDFHHFAFWIPNYILQQKNTMDEVQNNIIRIKTQIRQLLDLFSSVDSPNSNIEMLKEKSYEIISGIFSPKSNTNSFEALYQEKKDPQSSLVETEQSIIAYLERKIKTLKKKLTLVIAESQKIINEKELKINQLEKENELLKRNLIKLKTKIRKLKAHNNTPNTVTNPYQNLQEEKNQLKVQNGALINRNQSLVDENLQLFNSLQKLQDENNELKKENSRFDSSSFSSMQETLTNLSDENRMLKENIREIEIQNKKLLDECNNQNSSLFSVKQNNSSSNDSVVSIQSIDDSFEIEKKTLQDVIKEQDDKIHFLEKKLITAESEKLKQMEMIKQRNKEENNQEMSYLDLKKIGFILAEALCQRYNPGKANSEIQRLIEVARQEHIKLSETVRYPIDPFNNSNSMMSEPAEKNPIKANIYSKFDELDRELTTFKLSVL